MRKKKGHDTNSRGHIKIDTSSTFVMYTNQNNLFDVNR